MVEQRCLCDAEAQCGVFRLPRGGPSARQVQYRVKQGRWARVLPGVYRVCGAPQSWNQSIRAALLWAGSRSWLSHAAAARLHGFPGFERDTRVCVTTTRCLRSALVSVHRVSTLSHRDAAELQSLNVTSVARTLVDVASELTEPQLAACLDEMLSKRKVTLEEVERAASRAKGRPGVRTLRTVIASRDGSGGPTESELERRGLEVMEQAGLPRPKTQKHVQTRQRRARVDCCFEAQRVVVELDGYAHHSDVRAFEEDRTRTNGLVARGFVVLRWTWRALEDHPELLIEELVTVLESRALSRGAS